jgi:hypothetical protein
VLSLIHWALCAAGLSCHASKHNSSSSSNTQQPFRRGSFPPLQAHARHFQQQQRQHRQHRQQHVARVAVEVWPSLDERSRSKCVQVFKTASCNINTAACGPCVQLQPSSNEKFFCFLLIWHDCAPQHCWHVWPQASPLPRPTRPQLINLCCCYQPAAHCPRTLTACRRYVNSLNKEHGLPGFFEFYLSAASGQPVLYLMHPRGHTLEVQLQGATITRYGHRARRYSIGVTLVHCKTRAGQLQRGQHNLSRAAAAGCQQQPSQNHSGGLLPGHSAL